MNRLILLFSSFILGIAVVSAQTTPPSLPDKCQAFYPEVLLTNSVLTEDVANALAKSSDFGQNKPPRNQQYWIVYSDRSNNTTFTAPGGLTPYKKLDFNQKVRIAKIQNGYALVYTEPVEDEAYPLISQFATVMGWIPMKNLLLWHSALANEKGIYNKALLCINLNEASSSTMGKLYTNPNKTDYEPLSNDMSFYFVMKREGDLTLLSRVHSMDGIHSVVLHGWLSKDSYVEWNQRSCLEPNWDKRDVEYFADEGVEARIYESSQNKGKIVNRITFKRKTQVSQGDKYVYRQHPDLLRFPILDNSDNPSDQYRCSTFGTIDGSVTNASDIVESTGSISSYKEEVLRKMTNVNIGIVIDGTRSMDKFYPAVKSAIKECKRVFNDSKYKVKVGIVIYRDYSDGEYVVEKRKLTNPDNPSLYSFLDTGGEYGIKSHPSDITYEEALYYGINSAIDQLGFNPEHSNILLVIGDCGNARDDNKISRDAIINKLVNKNINIVGFQVRQGAHDAFGLFNNQLGIIMKQSLEKRYAAISTEHGNINIKDTKDGYKLVHDDATLFVGSLNYPLQDQEMPTTKLVELIQESIIMCSEAVQKQITLIDLGMARGFASSYNGEAFSKFEADFVRDKIGAERFDLFQKANAMFAFKGFVDKRHESNRDYFKPVIFISSDELNTLISRLAPVNDAAQQLLADPNADRSPYIRAMKALIQIMIPEDATDERMNRMTYNEIMELVSGLNESANALKGYSLAELASPEAVPHAEFVSLVSDFNRKFRNLQRIKSAKYEYAKTENGIKYYWLPVEDLP